MLMQYKDTVRLFIRNYCQTPLEIADNEQTSQNINLLVLYLRERLHYY